MSSIAELVELLKDGNISKEQMLEMIYSQSFPNKQEHITTADMTQGGTLIVDSNRDYDFEFSANEFEEFRRGSFDPSFAGQADGFVDRQAQWDVRKKIYQDMMRKQKDKLEIKECTFHPRTNVGRSNFSQKTVERLSKKREDSRYEFIRQEQERKKLEEEVKECTFQPEINKNSCVFGSRYWSDTPKKKVNAEEPAFAPKVKGPSRNMKTANEYVKQDPFERLSRPKPVQTLNESVEKPQSLSAQTPDYGCSFASRPFFERQALYELMKYEKREALEQDVPEGPVLNERSKKLVKTSFHERNNEMIERKKNKKSEDLGTFQPKITALGKMSRNRSFKEMSYEDSKKKMKKIESLREQADEKIREIICAPAAYQSKSYSNIKSKLQLIEDPQSYVDRLKLQQRKKELEAQILKEEKIREETMECTYSPAIIDAPDYVKQIARNMAMIRSEATVNKKPPRPEWR